MSMYKCPYCGETDCIDITAMVDVRLVQADDCFETDADEAQDRSHDWDENSPARCAACLNRGKVGDFLADPVTTGDRRDGQHACEQELDSGKAGKPNAEVPALYDMDIAWTVDCTYFFCTCECQTAFSKRHQGVIFGCGFDRDYTAETVCDECAGPLSGKATA